MNEIHPFRQQLKAEYETLVARSQQLLVGGETLKIDLHCHDRNSDVPDELWGRILRLPETWLPTAELVRRLKDQGTDLITVTNHNNARSCWELMDRGMDVLPGAELTCHFPDGELSIHVLTYGFDPAQEEQLKRLRHNIYRFQAYTAEHNLPTVLPHPFYFYGHGNKVPPETFEKIALLFERFEVLNGQRDTWQNLLALEWVRAMDSEKIWQWQRKHGLDPADFCRNPYTKRMTGGSDDHMGLFVGSCGTLLSVPNLQVRRKRESLSALALEALRSGATAPYGTVHEGEKLTIALVDFFCQVALNIKDPGLVRMLLHKGRLKDKLWCLAIGNGMMELKRHRYTLRFLKTFHEALNGKKPGLMTSFQLSKSFKPLLRHVERIAVSMSQAPGTRALTMSEAMEGLFHDLNRIIVQRFRRNVKSAGQSGMAPEPGRLIRKLEVPIHFRTLFGGELKAATGDMTQVNLAALLDRVSFPALAATVLAGAAFTSAKSLYANRSFLNQIAETLGRHGHPRRMLWLTDSLFGKNGVSSALRVILDYVRRHDLPIDFMICGEEEPGPHLRVVRPIGEWPLPQFGDHVLRLPDLLEVQRKFLEGGYDRLICSTELMMAPIALYLKQAFHVPAYFYMHTDWLTFFENTTSLDVHALDRVRRILRALYKRFDAVFVLNSEHSQWLAGRDMGIARIHATAHWVPARYRPMPQPKSQRFPGIGDHRPVLLFAGRLSEEKGVFDLPYIFERVRAEIKDVALAVCGTGPAEGKLKELLPEALFLGWVEEAEMPSVFSSADLLVLPSRFDTFGCVVLEAMSCGLPVAAYDAKGPRDIIVHGVNGFLSESRGEMAAHIVAFLNDERDQARIKTSALLRSTHYRADEIMAHLLHDTGLQLKNMAHLAKRPKPSMIGDAVQPVSPEVSSNTEDFLEELLAIVEG